MEKTDSVLSSVRGFLNIDKESDVFDGEIIPHIMSAIGKLSQNGVGVSKFINSETKWSDIINPTMISNDEVFTLIPLYVMLSTKMLFDPPPPSTIPYYQSTLDDNLWRLRLIHDTWKVDETQTDEPTEVPDEGEIPTEVPDEGEIPTEVPDVNESTEVLNETEGE